MRSIPSCGAGKSSWCHRSTSLKCATVCQSQQTSVLLSVSLPVLLLQHQHKLQQQREGSRSVISADRYLYRSALMTDSDPSRCCCNLGWRCFCSKGRLTPARRITPVLSCPMLSYLLYPVLTLSIVSPPCEFAILSNFLLQTLFPSYLLYPGW